MTRAVLWGAGLGVGAGAAGGRRQQSKFFSRKVRQTLLGKKKSVRPGGLGGDGSVVYHVRSVCAKRHAAFQFTVYTPWSCCVCASASGRDHRRVQ